MTNDTIQHLTSKVDSISTDIVDIKLLLRDQQNLHKGQQDTLNELVTQVKYTNGKVMLNTKWRWVIVGGAIVTATFVFPSLIWFYQNFLSESAIKQFVAQGLEQQLSQYEIEIEN